MSLIVFIMYFVEKYSVTIFHCGSIDPNESQDLDKSDSKSFTSSAGMEKSSVDGMNFLFSARL